MKCHKTINCIRKKKNYSIYFYVKYSDMFYKFSASQLIRNSVFSEPYMRFLPNEDHSKVEIMLILMKGNVKMHFSHFKWNTTLRDNTYRDSLQVNNEFTSSSQPRFSHIDTD